ncbi:hypothetical protein Pcinc_020599 [Petrolisthes cinctipes]|uniref:Uncharacterized protein n=1 Tax=Petrolisthes cinctipes TaxID=88211 RepID=A0AAE1KJJ7_PETCI|nr:hypothetical protein Pcinc_020599 [Petrolisthes cinctipes]
MPVEEETQKEGGTTRAEKCWSAQVNIWPAGGAMIGWPGEACSQWAAKNHLLLAALLVLSSWPRPIVSAVLVSKCKYPLARPRVYGTLLSVFMIVAALKASH